MKAKTAVKQVARMAISTQSEIWGSTRELPAARGSLIQGVEHGAVVPVGEENLLAADAQEVEVEGVRCSSTTG